MDRSPLEPVQEGAPLAHKLGTDLAQRDLHVELLGARRAAEIEHDVATVEEACVVDNKFAENQVADKPHE